MSLFLESTLTPDKSPQSNVESRLRKNLKRILRALEIMSIFFNLGSTNSLTIEDRKRIQQEIDEASPLISEISADFQQLKQKMNATAPQPPTELDNELEKLLNELNSRNPASQPQIPVETPKPPSPSQYDAQAWQDELQDWLRPAPQPIQSPRPLETYSPVNGVDLLENQQRKMENISDEYQRFVKDLRQKNEEARGAQGRSQDTNIFKADMQKTNQGFPKVDPNVPVVEGPPPPPPSSIRFFEEEKKSGQYAKEEYPLLQATPSNFFMQNV